ncbi:MAG: LPS export ABC transporter periplasmic protein LptC [Candidatus Accumulibacter sp.]|jgi:lipopolysaccharide export system protein LptC|nr:LPS export ABC transporter periplasmic protein LptC [Accumulibacter sp.]
MKHWHSAIFPLTLLFTLAALTFWLRHISEIPGARHDGHYRHDPDYIVKGSTLRKINPAGELLYTLKSPETRHYPDDGTLTVAYPSIIYLNPGKPPVTLTSDLGIMRDEGEEIDLQGNVRIVRDSTPTDPQMVATMPQLTVLSEEEKAFTRAPVVIVQGKSWVKGVGMRIDNRAQTYLLESRASAFLEQK